MQDSTMLGGTRGGVSSAGVTFRGNLVGSAVGQFAVVRPLQRAPGRRVDLSVQLDAWIL
jgi:hypothetical protein